MRRGAVILSCFLTLYSSISVQMFVEAAETKSIQMETDSSMIVPYADVIETKYRIIDGRIQYRRWNVTKGYWVDAKWIDL